MANIEIDIEKLKTAHKKANASGKKLLEQLHGAGMFKPDITEIVKNVKDACIQLGLDFGKEFSKERTKYEKPDETAYREWKIFAEAMNQGVEVDYYNKAQKKWTLYVQYTASGRGLSIGVVYCAYAFTNVGPRLCFLNEKHARHFFDCCPDTINKFFSPKSK